MSIRQHLSTFFSEFAQDPSAGAGARVADMPNGSIEIESVTKRFRKVTASKKSYTTVKSDVMGWFKNRKESGEVSHFDALSDVSFSIEPGSSLGIVGRNGSGKSTILKLIAGIYHPDQGTVRVRGTISALIELGAGFHPDFTGRENVFLGGIMYGLSKKEIEARFDDIVRYAELEDCIDDPVRTYSSGMYMRLGFSLAVHTDPDILLVDEVLAVGDATFINRCQETISEFRRRGKTLIFVTHDLSSVSRWCDDAIWLDKGKVRERGEPRYVIDKYLGCVEDAEEAELKRRNEGNLSAENLPLNLDPRDDARGRSRTRWGNKDVEILEVKMSTLEGEDKWLFHGEEGVRVRVTYQINKPLKDLVFGIGVLRADGTEIHGSNTEIDDVSPPLPAENDTYPQTAAYEYNISRLGLLEDSYYLDVAAHSKDGLPYDYHHRLHNFSIRSSKKHSGIYNPPHQWSFEGDEEKFDKAESGVKFARRSRG